MEPIKIFIGNSTNGSCSEACMALEWSIKKHSTNPYQIIRMMGSDDQNNFWFINNDDSKAWNTKYWSTPFSGFRYGIAKYCNFKGKAIYVDDDMLFLRDPKILWNIFDFQNQNYCMTGKLVKNNEIRHCVSLINCEHEIWKHIDPFKISSENRENRSYPEYNEFCKINTFDKTFIIDRSWNCFDGEDMKIEDISLLHLTDLSTNPAIKLAINRLGSQNFHWYDGELREHPRKDIEELWYSYYNESIVNGYNINDYIPKNYISLIKQSQKDYKANNGWH